MGSKTRGAALILVLMVVGILGLLALQMGLNAKANVSRAERLQQRTEAMLRLQSNEAALVFTLLTEPWVTGRERDTDNPYAKVWNFYGDPFEVDGVRYAIQDHNGLLQMPQRGDPVVELGRLLENIGIDSSRTKKILEELRLELDREVNTKGAGRQNLPWQSIDELRYLGDFSDDELYRLRELLTLYPTSYFNPATAPTAVLATRFSGTTLESLLSQQTDGGLTADTYYRITGMPDNEFTVFFPGPAFRISTEYSEKEFRIKSEKTLLLRPYGSEAVRLWERRQ